MMQWESFPEHGLFFQTGRAILRPFRAEDLETARAHLAPAPPAASPEDSTAPPAAGTREDWELALAERARGGFVFAIDYVPEVRTVGDVSLQWLHRPESDPEGERVMRVPLAIWDRSLWGRGLGGEVLDCLMRYAFVDLEVDRLCALEVARRDRRSLNLFRSRGLRAVRSHAVSDAVDLEITRMEYFSRRAVSGEFRTLTPESPGAPGRRSSGPHSRSRGRSRTRNPIDAID